VESSFCHMRTSWRPIKKIILEKIINIWNLALWGKFSNLRSRHLVLWSLETLIGQQRFYGTRLVTWKRRYYHPLKRPTWGRLHYWFCLKLLWVCLYSIFLSLYNIHDSSVSEYLSMNISNSSVGKYYATQITEYS